MKIIINILEQGAGNDFTNESKFLGQNRRHLYEMIQMSDDGLTRARTWQWFKNDRLFQRTLIDETRVSLDWSAYEGVDPLYDEITV